MTLVRALYWTAFSMPLCKSSTDDWSREKAMNASKYPKETARHQHHIWCACCPSKLCNEKALWSRSSLHTQESRHVSLLKSLDWKLVCSYCHRELHKGFKFHTRWALPTSPTQHNRAVGDVPGTASSWGKKLVKEGQGAVLCGKRSVPPSCSVCAWVWARWD